MTLPNPKHYWRFDEGNTTQSTDSVGGAKITFEHSSFRPGRVGTALRIHPEDGAGRVETDLPDRAPPWTVSMWLKREADAESSALLSSEGFALKLEQWPNKHTLGLTRFTTADVVGVDLGSAYKAPIDEWVHLTYVGTATDTKVYANGELQTTFAQSINLPLKWIGSTHGYNERGAFLLDELKIFDQVLTSDQIRELAELPPPRKPTKVAFGKTVPGQGWKHYTTNSVTITVDTSSGKFSGIPVYTFTLAIPGLGSLWMLTGTAHIQNPTSTGFTIYVKDDTARA